MTVLSGLLQPVAAAIRRYRMIAPGDRIGVAVSGGADSVCLLHALRELDLAPLTVLHLDHQLRGAESRGDAEFVAGLASRLGLPIVSRRASLSGANLEEAGRLARLDFFREAIRAGTVNRVATGHTRSDQAETVLFRLLRGAAGEGLSGIRPVTSDGFIRPLLWAERGDVLSYLEERGIEWREDSTNASLDFDRNRIRHELLPQLQRDWNAEIVDTLARTADWAAAESAYWEAELDRLEREALTDGGGAVLLEIGFVSSMPLAAARRLVRRAIERAKGDLRGIGFVHSEAVVDLVRSDRGAGGLDLPGLTVRRSQNWLRFEIQPSSAGHSGDYWIEATAPGVVAIPGAAASIRLDLIENYQGSSDGSCVYNGEMGCADWDRVSGSLILRNWRPGDRFQPPQSARARKLKTLFQSARIPRWERQRWPVLASGDAIVWTRHFGVSAGFAAGPQTRAFLRVSEMAAE